MSYRPDGDIVHQRYFGKINESRPQGDFWAFVPETYNHQINIDL
jgi:hypothetical protein